MVFRELCAALSMEEHFKIWGRRIFFRLLPRHLSEEQRLREENRMLRAYVWGLFMMYLLTTFLNAANLSVGMQRLIQGAVLVLILVASVSDDAKKIRRDIMKAVRVMETRRIESNRCGKASD